MARRFVLPGVSRASPYHRPRTAAGEDRHGSLAPEQRDSPAPSRRLEKRHYNNGEAEFILEPLSPSVVQVTHREQVAYFGTNLNWDVLRPYAWTTLEYQVQADGIGGAVLWAATPDDALRALCRSLVSSQRREDSRRINPEERMVAARQVLGEFLEELPE